MAQNPAIKTVGINVRNLPHVHASDPKLHEALQDLKSHIELLKGTVQQQASALAELQQAKK